MIEIRDDKLVRQTPVYSDRNGSFETVRTELVMTREEFLLCYNEWVLKPMQKNPVSVQSGFLIPVDNNGVTPV